ncbi:MAG: ImmA/IrrE family metallo-endopeptidase, partial [Candidatus Heimdallarchaeota archaeon]|nr:ImmA/IrrE family metallo-endopeptidase [Candidatus Heimdallarchaeota archaeon]
IYGVQPSSLFNEPQKTQKRKGFFDRMSFRGETEIPKEVKESVGPCLVELRKIGRLQKDLGLHTFDHKEIFDGDIGSLPTLAVKRRVAKEAAKKLRTHFSIREDENIDIANFIVNQLNIPVVGKDLGSGTWGIYSKDIFQNPLIIYSDSHAYQGRKRFSIAHELGHFIFHNNHFEIDNDNTSRKDDNERVADAFAQELLVSTIEFRKVFDDFKLSLASEINPYYVALLANHFQVSFLMITFTLKDLGKISDTLYKKLSDFCRHDLGGKAESLGYNTEDAFIPPLSLRDRVKNLALVAKNKNLIGSDEFSKLTGIAQSDLNKVI